MRSSTMLLVILFLVAITALTMNLIFAPMLDAIIVRYAEESVPHAIIPDEVREKWDREGWPDIKTGKPGRTTQKRSAPP